MKRILKKLLGLDYQLNQYNQRIINKANVFEHLVESSKNKQFNKLGINYGKN